MLSSALPPPLSQDHHDGHVGRLRLHRATAGPACKKWPPEVRRCFLKSVLHSLKYLVSPTCHPRYCSSNQACSVRVEVICFHHAGVLLMLSRSFCMFNLRPWSIQATGLQAVEWRVEYLSPSFLLFCVFVVRPRVAKLGDEQEVETG